MNPSPETFKKRILIAVSGMSPQIITETIYALAQQDKPFIPTEVHILTTQNGANNAKLNLLTADKTRKKGWFYLLCDELNLNAIDFSEKNIHVILNQKNQPLDDIRTPRDNEDAATFITEFIRQKSQDNEAALHISIAGGRKTMGYYMGYAISLFGRDQDRLSHVLVSEDYEGNRDFYFPTNDGKTIYTRDNKPLDPAKATVALADIPFLRIHNDESKYTVKGDSFRQTIQAIQEKLKVPQLKIAVKNKRHPQVWMNDHAIQFTPQELVFYCWVIDKQLKGSPLVPVTEQTKNKYAAEFLSLFEQIIEEDPIQKIEDAFKDGMKKNYISSSVNGIKKTLEAQLGMVASAFMIQNKTIRPATYMIDVKIENIEYLQ